MKAEDCQIGMIVYYDGEINYKHKLLTLPDSNDKVKVQSIKGGEISTDDIKHFRIFDDKKLAALGADMQSKIDVARNAFEIAFDALREVLNFKDDNGEYVSRYDLKDLGIISFEELESTIENNGWRSSSLWC